MSDMRRYPRGARPQFFEDPGLDEAMSMILVLASELSVLRDRLDTYERLSADGKAPSQADVERYQPDEETLNAREAARQDLFERLYFVARKRAQEIAEQDHGQRYREVLDDAAGQPGSPE
ncbi:MAG: hypothetical protein AAGA23_16950 [Pseudomonadota bacterium]